MPYFPLRHRPAESYHEAPRNFGAVRDHGVRKHAGCDLYAPAGTEVLACADGVVVLGPYLFYDVVYALEVRHPGLGVIRYGEIQKKTPAKVGDQVKAGQVIAYVGKMLSVPQSMLHFEFYSGVPVGPLTDRTRLPYMRRADLLNPTPFLDVWELAPQPGPTGATT